MTTNIIRCSDSQHAVATKCRNASNGTSQARTRPMKSALSSLNQTPKREVVKSAPHPHLHPHFRHFGDITSPSLQPCSLSRKTSTTNSKTTALPSLKSLHPQPPTKNGPASHSPQATALQHHLQQEEGRQDSRRQVGRPPLEEDCCKFTTGAKIRQRKKDGLGEEMI